MVFPRNVDGLRADSLVDPGVPESLDKVLIEDQTDGLIKSVDVSDVFLSLNNGTAGVPVIRATNYSDTGVFFGDDLGVPHVALAGGGTGNLRASSAETFFDKKIRMGSNAIEELPAPVNGNDATRKTYVDNRMPTGSFVMYGASSAPTGWLLCDGSAVSRTTYADLFAIIGTTFGAGDGSTTFNVPNLSDRFPIGYGLTALMGATGGAADHSHTGPSHTHNGPSHRHTNPNVNFNGDHAHSQGNTGSGGSHSHGAGTYTARISNKAGTSTTVNLGYDPRSISFTANRGIGGADAFSSVSYGRSDGAIVQGTSTSQSSHTHANPNVNGNGGHVHSQSDTGWEGTGNTGSSGTGATSTDNNLPPYVGVGFIIKT